MAFHELSFVQNIPVSIDTAWSFFSSPKNLARITPPEMMFRITGGSLGEEIYPGMTICYTLYPFMMIPVNWTTEIVRVSKPDFFEDRQIRGPYEEWNHRHLFRVISGGVEMTDMIEYRLPLDLFGDLINEFVVARRLDEVFGYRRRKIGDILGYIAG
jgi:ligand-binding SRPBCC domain-containing protein